MNNYNKEMAKRVWQRVQSAQAAQPQPNQQQVLLQLIEQEWQTADCYQRLAGHLTGQQAALAKNLHTKKKEQVACLKGLYKLVTGATPNVPAKPVGNEPVHAMLRRCYGLQMRCLARYETAVQDGEHGAVYARLCAHNKEHCQGILSLLGETK